MHTQSSEQVLYLAKSFTPDVDMVLENGIAAFGIKGSGKTNLVALLVEQLSRFLLPQIIFDTEHEYESLLAALPHGVLATVDSLPSAYEILTCGLQVVISLHESTPAHAAIAMADLLYDLFTVASAQQPLDRVPCVIHTDEAGYWLPQKAVSYLPKETRATLLDSYSLVVSRGRKFGLVPFFYTQYISQINKDVVRQSGLHILMRQTQDNDIKRYGEYMRLTAERKEQIASFGKGEAVIHGLPDGRVKHIHFYERATAHTSHTPKARAAIAKFANTRNEYDSLQPASQPQETVKTLAGYYSIDDVCKLVGRSRGTIYRRANELGIKFIHGPVTAGHARPMSMIARADVEVMRRAIMGL